MVPVNTRLWPGAKDAIREKNRFNGFALVLSWFTALKRSAGALTEKM
jgi:hypothetical protein